MTPSVSLLQGRTFHSKREALTCLGNSHLENLSTSKEAQQLPVAFHCRSIRGRLPHSGCDAPKLNLLEFNYIPITHSIWLCVCRSSGQSHRWRLGRSHSSNQMEGSRRKDTQWLQRYGTVEHVWGVLFF